MAAEFLSSPAPTDSEWTPPAGLPYTIAESYLKGKECADKCEDGIVATADFAAVVDGSTAKSDFQWQGRKTGRLAMETITRAIRYLPAGVSATEAVRTITDSIRGFYETHGMTRRLAEEPGCRLTACAVIYSRARGEVWQIGDCQCIIGGSLKTNEKEIDRIMAEARAAYNEVALALGATQADIEASDPGRAFIGPFLQRQAILQNSPDSLQRLAFAALDGFPVNMRQVKVHKVSKDVTEIVLASDGYPSLCPTLLRSEALLRQSLAADPMCMRQYKSTKGVKAGNRSFDDRSYLRIRVR